MQNQFDVVLSKLSEETKNEIVANQEVNLKDMNGKNMYNGRALDYFFKLWHVHFPNVKQSMTCKGCRDGVVKFFHRIAELIKKEQNDIKVAAEVRLFEEKAKKNKKARAKKAKAKKSTAKK